ncbi:UNVERIFIED_CONTAM: protein ACTIVITY OF BC1 COMPLEX kinase, chloroplastic [Sesamum calycinum]|uniref:Protein ACTIVITY OF BC1 COMPLEX kinase, chloroplastic n=1 Tax=Sesamum calycinum TaxID=2727403 RepID=A0AAW2KN47_9LAMI
MLQMQKLPMKKFVLGHVTLIQFIDCPEHSAYGSSKPSCTIRFISRSERRLHAIYAFIERHVAHKSLSSIFDYTRSLRLRKCFHGNREGVRHSQISLKLYRKMRHALMHMLQPPVTQLRLIKESPPKHIGMQLVVKFRDEPLLAEIDYTKEAANAEQFADNFKNMDYVKVPTILWEFPCNVGSHNGICSWDQNKPIKALDQLGVDRKRLGRYAVESYLEQILSHGFFHADPHPGNIAVDDVNGGRLIFYDFGMMGSIKFMQYKSRTSEKALLEVFYGVA